MSKKVFVLNLKEGRPGVAAARERLAAEIDRARSAGATAMKIIHGYGSGGAGGALREAVRRSLAKRKKEGRVRAFAVGEKWDTFDPAAALILVECPALARDPDLNRYNEGITLVLL